LTFWPPNLESLFALSLVSGIWAIYGIRRGAFPYLIGHIDRATKPIRFWVDMGLYAIICIGCLTWAALRIGHYISN
jgi:uncharacterized membrane protein YedE/YeeE